MGRSRNNEGQFTPGTTRRDRPDPVAVPPTTSANGSRVENTDVLGRAGRTLGLTDQELSSILGVSIGASRDARLWPVVIRHRVEQLTDLAERIEQTFTPESIPVWLTEPNRDLHGLVPLAMIRAGRIAEVEAALEAIDSGVYV
jgi:hypothetical protein